VTAPTTVAGPVRWDGARSRALTRLPLVGLNFHWLSRENWPVAERQVRAAAAAGVGYDLDGDAAAEPGVPRVLVAFYDGFGDTGRFGAELCHDLGLRAFFFPLFDPRWGPDMLDDDDLAAIGAVHEVGFHTATHAAAAEVGPDRLEAEVREPYERIRAATGRAPRVGAWRDGTRFDPALPGNRLLRDLGLTHLVSNWSVEEVPGAAGST